MRLFVALEVPEDKRRSVEKAIQMLRLRLPDARWVRREQWHCTLKFLGEVPDDRILEVERIVVEACKKTPPSETRLTEIGSFPSRRRARVIWAGLDDPDHSFEHLAARLEKKFGRAGLRQESRKLHLHMTLARLKVPGDISKTLEESGPYDFDRTVFEANEAVVFRSRLSPAGATYEALSRTPFGG